MRYLRPVLLFCALTAPPALLLPACGASFYAKKQTAAEGIQEESAKRQAAETDSLIRADWFICNRWSDRAARGAQNVLAWRLEVAKGTVGARENESKAEGWADKVLKSVSLHCDVANDTSLLLRGVPADLPAAPPPAPVGTIVTPLAPAVPAVAVPAPPPAPAGPSVPVPPAIPGLPMPPAVH